MSSAKTLYYYSGGEKIALRPVKNMVALESASGETAVPQELQQELAKLGEPATEGISIVGTKQVGSKALRSLAEKGMTYPVFSGDADGMLVALPEVRVQAGTGDTDQKLQAWIEKNKDRVEVIKQKYGQIVLRPVSGKAEDALKIANDIYRKVRPAMSQPRFLRIVERP